MNFKHPEDAMRARILGQLCCAHCMHMTRGSGWCKAEHNGNGRFFFGESIPGEPGLTSYCPDFTHSPKTWKSR